jgi:glyoxylase-like metal-dependent hydrolase (beta-lactamase superfamily II)
MPGQHADLRAELAAMGRSITDIKAVVLTHGDSDHIGFAGRLHAELGVPVYVHEADAARARGEVKKPSTGWGPVKIRPFLGFMAYGLRKGGLGSPKVGELATVVGEATLDLPGSPRIIPVPGHTPGSVAIHVPSVGALFAGDAMTTRSVLTGETGPRLAPFTLDRAAALASLERLDGIEAAWLLPGHGEAWTGGVGECCGRSGRQPRRPDWPSPRQRAPGPRQQQRARGQQAAQADERDAHLDRLVARDQRRR